MKTAQEVTFRKDAVIVAEGDIYQRLYQVIRGSVRVERSVILPNEEISLEHYINKKNSLRDKGRKILTRIILENFLYNFFFFLYEEMKGRNNNELSNKLIKINNKINKIK